MFTEDLIRTLRAWRDQPSLPLSALAFDLVMIALAIGPWLVFYAAGPDHFGAPGTALLVSTAVFVVLSTALWLGFAAAQRVWYARLFEGGRMRLGEVFSTAGRLMGPYLLLALLGAMIGLVVLAPLWSLSPTFAMFLAVFVVDVLFTFATSAVAVSGVPAHDAIGVSWRMIRSGWSRCKRHVLLPPLLFYVLPGRTIPLFVISELAVVAARGVTTSYYLRETAADLPSAYVEDWEPAPLR